MKLIKPVFFVRKVVSTLDNKPVLNSLGDALKNELDKVCNDFLWSKEEDFLQAVKEMKVNSDIAIANYITGIKIQNFANNAASHDNVLLEEDINFFIKKFRNTTGE